jgi:hypothetical protein
VGGSRVLWEVLTSCGRFSRPVGGSHVLWEVLTVLSL